jgi:hypothetical protein
MAGLDLSRVMAKIDAIGEGFANREAKVGWFSSDKYEDGTPVAYVAAIQEFGGTFEHPGGTHYRIGADGMATFVANSAPGAADLPVTKAHSITIPARPFVRPTVQDKGTEWSKQIAGGMRKVIKGQMTADDVLGAVGTLAAADIAKTIAAGDFTALSAATLAQRAAKGQGTAPLQATGLLIATIDSQVTDAS